MVATPSWKMSPSIAQSTYRSPQQDLAAVWAATLAAQTDTARAKALTPLQVYSRVDYREGIKAADVSTRVKPHWKLWLPSDVRLVGGSTFAHDLAWAGGRDYYAVDLAV